MGKKHKQKKLQEAVVVRHIDEQAEKQRAEEDAVLAIDTTDPFMDPVLKMFIEERREERRQADESQPCTLADIKHPPILIKQSTSTDTRQQTTAKSSFGPCRTLEAIMANQYHSPKHKHNRKQKNTADEPAFTWYQMPEPNQSQQTTTLTQQQSKKLVVATPALSAPPQSVAREEALPPTTNANSTRTPWWSKPPVAKQPKRKPKQATAENEVSPASGGWDLGLVFGDPEASAGVSFVGCPFLPAFRDGQDAMAIIEWIYKTNEALERETLEIPMSDYQRYLWVPVSVRQALTCDEKYWTNHIVPDYWVPERVGHQSRDLFWKELKSTNPKPVDPEDLDNAWPWWIDFPPHQGAFIQTFEHPNVVRIDPAETAKERAARAKDQGSDHNAKLWVESVQSEPRRHREKKTVIKPTFFQPRMKLLIRLARREDMPGIADIYNRYTRFSSVTMDAKVYTEEDMTERWQAIEAQGLPFVVACVPSSVLTCRRSSIYVQPNFMPEKVVGFATVSDLDAAENASRESTKEIRIFTAHEFYMNGIGTCLLDKLIKAVHASHKELTACEADVAPLPAHMLSAIKTLSIKFMWEPQQENKLAWVTRWLKKFGFSVVASYPGVGSKFGTATNLTVFRKSL